MLSMKMVGVVLSLQIKSTRILVVDVAGGGGGGGGASHFSLSKYFILTTTGA